MGPATTTAPGLALPAQTAGGITIAELSGELDIACAPALREQLLGLLRPGRLVIDMSKVSYCDAGGVAVLIGTGRRARLLGGFLRLAAVSPQVGQMLHITGLRQQLGVSPPSRPRQPARRLPAAERMQPRRPGRPGTCGAASRHAGHSRATADFGELGPSRTRMRAAVSPMGPRM